MALTHRLKRGLARAALSAPPAWLRRAAGAARAVDGPPLDPQVQLLMRLGDALGEKRFEHLPVADSRHLMLAQTRIVDLPRAPGVEVASLTLPVSSGISIQARTYRPAQASRPSPALVYFHGGGFVVGIGSCESEIKGIGISGCGSFVGGGFFVGIGSTPGA